MSESIPNALFVQTLNTIREMAIFGMHAPGFLWTKDQATSSRRRDYETKVNLLILSFMAVAMGIVFGCSSGSVTSSEADGDSAAAKMVTDVAQGRALYASKCVGCHGNIDVTDIVTPTSFSDIRSAISGNMGGMGIYAAISDADVQALADALNSPATPAPAPLTTPRARPR